MDLRHRRRASARDLELGLGHFAQLSRLDSPQKIQGFLNRIPANHEPDGETILSAREVLRQRRAHCIEGAFVAAAALWIHGRVPWIVHLDCEISDFPHAICVFRTGGCWGAISKTNGAPLRFRDPVYRTLRELAISYFHEYSNRRGVKTLRSYSVPFDMRRMDPALWVTSEVNCWEAHDRLAATRHYALVSAKQARLLSRRDTFERRAGRLVQYPKPARARG